jgi:hypothetical protein
MMKTEKKHSTSGSAIRHAAMAGALALCLGIAPVALAQQKAFDSPEAAMNAFGDALARTDNEAMKALLGADYRSFIPPSSAEIRYAFLSEWAKAHAVKREGEAKAAITVGKEGWTMPIPLVKTAQGWRFDTRAGAEEMRIRRLGRNELAAMQALLAIRDAQLEYAQFDRDGNGLREYASRFQSSPGKRDGLYWPVKAGEPSSPLGPAFAGARAAGGSDDAGYYGYHYKLLSGQGKHAPGGAYDYLVGRGNKIGGFAVVAWPVRYGETGVMTFMVSHDGVVYQKDLGPGSGANARAITRFDPDPSWTKVDPDS